MTQFAARGTFALESLFVASARRAGRAVGRGFEESQRGFAKHLETARAIYQPASVAAREVDRSEEDPEPWLRELEQARRALRVRVAGRAAWIAVEDAGLYRDALGVAPPQGVAGVFLHPVERPLELRKRHPVHERTSGQFGQHEK